MDVNCEGLLKGKVDIETVKVPLNAGKEFFRQNPYDEGKVDVKFAKESHEMQVKSFSAKMQ